MQRQDMLFVKKALADAHKAAVIPASASPAVIAAPNVPDRILKKMAFYERQKYQPSPGYEYQSLAVDDRHVSYTHFRGKAPSKDQLAAGSQNTLMLRKLSLIAGVTNMLGAPGFLTDDAVVQKRIRKKLLDMADNVEASMSDIDSFMNDLTTAIKDELATTAEKDKVMRSVRNAERYFVADYQQSHVQINEFEVTVKGVKKTYVQVDMPFGNQLTDQLKTEYTRIHASDEHDRPLWFNVLSDWEQQWLLARVPADLSDDWHPFETLFQSSAMQHIPGIKNARMNYLLEKKGTQLDVISSSFKTATLVPYEMPEKEHLRIGTMHAEQVIGRLAAENGSPVYLNSLLSDTALGGLDNPLTATQAACVKAAAAAFSPLKVITGNDPVNILGALSPSVGILSDKSGRLDHVHAVIKFYDELVINKTPMKDAALAKLAVAELKKIQGKPFSLFSARNLMAHQSAYVSILIEAMGGLVSTNCKSGKDRTGLDELYRAAMRIYYQTYGELPSYTDSEKDRQKFIDIFVVLFETQKAQAAAAANTPGSFGLKDTARMLCRDIRHKLGGVYSASNDNANINKSKKQISDEEAFLRDLGKLNEHLKSKDKTVKSESARVEKLLPYLDARIQMLQEWCYSERGMATKKGYIQQWIAENEALIEKWLLGANDVLRQELLVYQQENVTLKQYIADVEKGSPKKIVYYGDNSEELTPTIDKPLEKVVAEAVASAVPSAAPRPYFSVSSADDDAKVKFTESQSVEYARKNVSTINSKDYTTIQHRNASGKCVSHLLFKDADLEVLSKKDMILLAVRQVEEFRAISKGGMLHFNGRADEPHKAKFIKKMMRYCDIMGISYEKRADLELKASGEVKFKKELDEMKRSSNYSPSLFKYIQIESEGKQIVKEELKKPTPKNLIK